MASRRSCRLLNTASLVFTLSLAAAVASVSAGLVQALRPGVVTIRATRGGVSGTLDVTVTGATLTSIDIGPAFTLPKGVGKRLTATGTFSDLSTRDLTTSVTWSTSVPSIGLGAHVGFAVY